MIVIDCPDLHTLYVPCWGELSFVASWLGLVDVFRRRMIPFRILNTILQGAQKRNELVCLWAGTAAKVERVFAHQHPMVQVSGAGFQYPQASARH